MAVVMTVYTINKSPIEMMSLIVFTFICIALRCAHITFKVFLFVFVFSLIRRETNVKLVDSLFILKFARNSVCVSAFRNERQQVILTNHLSCK